MEKTARAFKNGVTLVEMLVVMGVFAILAAAATPHLLGTQEKTFLQAEQEKISHHLKAGQQNAIAAYKGHDYQIQFDPPQGYVLQPNLENQTVFLHKNIQILTVDPQIITFEKLTGKPDNPLELTLISKRFKTEISMNVEGLVTTLAIERK